MLRRFRFALRPKWLAFHVFTIVVCVTMVLLGRWQLDVSNRKHFDLQNFGYALQWWLFTAFGLFVWFRSMREAAKRGGVPQAVSDAADRAEARRRDAEPVEYRRYVPPTNPVHTDDHVHSDYNDYLAGLAARDEDRR